MRFSHLSLSVHRTCPGGLVWLVAACALVRWTALGDPIDIVPAQGSTISTNINQREPAAKKDFGAMVPGPAQSFNPNASWQGITPSMMPPQENRTLTPRERELLDRRRNWVFMTPEELMSGENPEEMLGIKEYNKDGTEKEPMTAMERYYEHLIKGRRNIVTNQFDSDSDSWNTATNMIDDGEQNGDSTHSFDSPFNSRLAHQIFRPMRPNTFLDVFGTRPDLTASDPETIREAQEQSNHIESFKQLWDIEQSRAPAAASISSSSGSGSGASSFPSMQPVLGTVSSSVTGSSGQPNRASTELAPIPLHASPPRPTFTRQSPAF